MTSFKQYIRSRYDKPAGELTGKYTLCLEKLSRFKNHVAFSARCKKEGVMPPSLRIKPPIDTVRAKEIAERASRQFLNERLRVANYKRRSLEEEAKWREIGLQRALNQQDFEKLKQINQAHAEKTFLQVRERQREKFDRMKNTKRMEEAKINKGRPGQSKENIDKSRWVVNLSKHKLTATERKVLERGLNFSDCPNKIPRDSIVAAVESALQNCKDKQRAERARATVASILTTAKPPKSNTSKEERDAMNDLQKNEKIIILPADKGTATVILDKQDYEDKAMEILAKPPFKRLNKDPTKRNENRVNDRLRRLQKSGAIDQEMFNKLKVSVNGSRTPLFYGSVKVHKADRPLRPIVSAVGSATYNLSKYVSDILGHYVKQSRSFLLDTKDFVAKLSKLSINEDQVLISFDVKSLFTSVPVPDAIRAITDLIEADDDFENRNNISTKTLIEMINICLASTSFQFRSHHYELTDGLAMGSPLSPAVANLFMASLEEKALASFPNAPTTWFRFVDDIFSIVLKADVTALLDHLNSQHQSISFTMESEVDGKLPYLDLNVHRCKEGTLKTSIYRKPTHTGSYLDFNSNHAESAKRSVVMSLLKRMDHITLGEEERRKEEKRIKGELEANGYPQTFFKAAKRRVENQKSAKPKSREETSTTVSIPYVRGISEAISRVLAPLGIRTATTTTKRKWTVMRRAKDALPADSTPGVIYAIGCKECPKVYVGETARTAKQRVKEHKDHTTKGNTEMSAIAKHVEETGHKIHWEARVLRKEGKTIKRKVHEALTIDKLRKRNSDHVMNKDSGMDLSNIWLS